MEGIYYQLIRGLNASIASEESYINKELQNLIQYLEDNNFEALLSIVIPSFGGILKALGGWIEKDVRMESERLIEQVADIGCSQVGKFLRIPKAIKRKVEKKFTKKIARERGRGVFYLESINSEFRSKGYALEDTISAFRQKPSYFSFCKLKESLNQFIEAYSKVAELLEGLGLDSLEYGACQIAAQWEKIDLPWLKRKAVHKQFQNIFTAFHQRIQNSAEEIEPKIKLIKRAEATKKEFLTKIHRLSELEAEVEQLERDLSEIDKMISQYPMKEYVERRNKILEVWGEVYSLVPYLRKLGRARKLTLSQRKSIAELIGIIDSICEIQDPREVIRLLEYAHLLKELKSVMKQQKYQKLAGAFEKIKNLETLIRTSKRADEEVGFSMEELMGKKSTLEEKVCSLASQEKEIRRDVAAYINKIYCELLLHD